MRFTTLAFLFALCTAPAPCQQEPEPSATALCEEAERLAEQGSHAAAVARFTAARRAEALDPDYRHYRELAEADAATVVQSLLGMMLFAAIWLGVLSLIGLALAGSTRRAMAAVPEGHTPARYDGSAVELFKVYLQNVALTVLTLGVYRFWARVRMQRYRYQHTAFGGARFDYHATGREKLVGFLKGMLVLAPLVAGLWLLHDLLLLPQYGDETAFTICLWSFALLLFLLRPLILVGSQRFNLSRTSWCNLRFRFTGRVGDAYRLYLKDLLLMVVTFGIYSTWHQANVRRFKLRNTRLGDLELDYKGDGGQLFGLQLVGGLLSYVTLGVYAPWWFARVHRYHLEHTWMRGRPFRSRLTGGHVLSVGAPALLVSIVTLGLGLPWALDRWYRLLTDTTSFPQPIDVDRLRALPDTQASPVLEGVGEAGEALSGLGDLFGG